MPSKLAIKLTQAVAAAFILGVIALISVLAAQPFLMGSLGSAAFIQILTPGVSSAKIWPMAAGQACGLVGGFCGVYAVAAQGAPAFNDHHLLVLIRVAAVAIAAALTAGLQLVAKAPNAAGGALALLLALGSEAPTWPSAGRLIAGIALVTVLGETARRLLIRMGA